MRKTNTLHFVLISSLALSGCASIVSGRHGDVAFDTYPTNAHVVIHDDRGRQVTALDTPGVATLKRQRRFFMPARYTATIMAPGYQTTQVPIAYTLNPWLLGNIVVGGIPGLVVDSATGAAWKPKHDEIHQHLARLDGESPASVYSANESPEQEPATPVSYTADRSGEAVSGPARK